MSTKAHSNSLHDAISALMRGYKRFIAVDRASRMDLLPSIVDTLVIAVATIAQSIPLEGEPETRVEANALRLANIHSRLDGIPDREKSGIICERMGISRATHYRYRAVAIRRKWLRENDD